MTKPGEPGSFYGRLVWIDLPGMQVERKRLPLFPVDTLKCRACKGIGIKSEVSTPPLPGAGSIRIE
jgi:hypothetical protein